MTSPDDLTGTAQERALAEEARRLGSTIPDDKWTFVGQDGIYRIYECEVMPGVVCRKREYALEDALLRQNAAQYDESRHKRFADTPIGTKVASIPLNRFFADFAGRHGDEEFAKHWLNSEKNREFRTFRGKL